MGQFDSSGNSQSIMNKDHQDGFGDTVGSIQYSPDFKSRPLTVPPVEAIDRVKYELSTRLDIILNQMLEDIAYAERQAIKIGMSGDSFVRTEKWAARERTKAALLKLMGK